jgi:hypothetical protein
MRRDRWGITYYDLVQMQGKIVQMAASDEGLLPANMVSYLLARACGRDRRPGGAVLRCWNEFQVR